MNIQELVIHQRSYYRKDHTLSYQFRKEQLLKLRKMIEMNEERVLQALKKDLNKSEFEGYSTEIGFLYAEINLVLKNLKNWMKPSKVKTPLSHSGSKSYIYSEPYGNTLIIAPWNYPFNLALAPVIGAIAGGNTIILKPSEHTPAVSGLLHEIVSDTFPSEYFAVVEGDVQTSQTLLQQRYDLIFFTGSVQVGKIVMEKASETLTPVVLELGGKSPVIVDKDAKLDVAAKRIVWGKFTNAGQTCIAPDYLYVHRDVKPELLAEMKKAINELYGEESIKNDNYAHIVNENHFNRLKSYLSNGSIVTGGKTDKESLTIEPTLLEEVSWDDPIMKDEIFGPILPVLTFDNLEDVIEEIRAQDKPLATYYFSENEASQEYILERLPFGGGCINDTIMHVANPYLPFGGVGHSGVGSYHGKASFDAFTNKKGVLKQTTKFDLSLRYPNTKHGLKIIKKLLK